MVLEAIATCLEAIGNRLQVMTVTGYPLVFHGDHFDDVIMVTGCVMYPVRY